MCKVIAVSNNKGGVAKTTSVVNIGIGLARRGYKVLLIDADSQGSLTASLGFSDPQEIEETLAAIFDMLIEETPFSEDYGIIHHAEGVDILPCNWELSNIEGDLGNQKKMKLLLKRYVDRQRERYDYILIDCSPSIGMITINVLVAADRVLIPIQATYLSLKGLEQLISTIGKVKRRLNPALGIEGILITMVNTRTIYAREITRLIIENYGKAVHIFENMIPMSVRAAEASAEGISIFKYDPKGKVAVAYEGAIGEVLDNE